MEALRCNLNPTFLDQFTNDVLTGLSQQQKTLPSKYFYNSRGSRLFDRICDLEEYYPYRTELSLLPRIAQEVSALLQQPYDIVEFGAGSLVKIRLLLQHLEHIRNFVPLDIAGEHLNKASALLKSEFPALSVMPIVCDFTRKVSLPTELTLPRLGFFPGSTIGNFTPQAAQTFLSNARKTLGPNAMLLIGVDSKKDPHILHRAYNDSLGVTAEFNVNLLQRINEEICGDFDVQAFQHYAFYNTRQGRIEMHLVSQKRQEVTIGHTRFSFAEGESIHTENSHKYTTQEFRDLAQKAGWQIRSTWADEQQLFRVHLLSS
ncbi:L-histidine N(alpha)-methyltransferase [Ketobacter sp. MCCC 1A13808]|uniref:L-histidine N(alpha)-methyltransferase n=1 Tax=Ketobacter sp. MCCC 1A13808 TaxID=2602738 RepID=UPI000F1CB8E4|nr:L-histidine N(alpha)-methyltransferase [Ketobacter sp. MCCC 1A13808]MVF13259.1 L-histidine N(alpha)-methyltransferase [Ketobacter sp. MCCC 1A13808]RLP54251.1 MAG: L-histidine N(alpha)-methyltransferase [Ketobacter sp.]